MRKPALHQAFGSRGVLDGSRQPQTALTIRLSQLQRWKLLLAATPDGIGCVGSSFFAQVASARLGTAMLKNQAGNFVAPDAGNVRRAAAELNARTPKDERLSLVFAPGADSYPLVNYEYAVVAAKQPNAATAEALRASLVWTVSEGRGKDRPRLNHFTSQRCPNTCAP
jgi:hypothetical protein